MDKFSTTINDFLSIPDRKLEKIAREKVEEVYNAMSPQLIGTHITLNKAHNITLIPQAVADISGEDYLYIDSASKFPLESTLDIDCNLSLRKLNHKLKIQKISLDDFIKHPIKALPPTKILHNKAAVEDFAQKYNT